MRVAFIDFLVDLRMFSFFDLIGDLDSESMGRINPVNWENFVRRY